LLINSGAERVPHTSQVTKGLPWERILELADEQDADIIVMGATGRGGLARQLRFGSSAEKVFRRANCRVMFVR
jgi:nucleotide-binding universal stress UspA family protein